MRHGPHRRVEAAAAGSESATTGRGYRVLVVEDNDEVGQFSMELLEDLGYAAKRVANADAALAILAEDEFAADLVFSDVIMPGMNGVELAGVIRARYPGLPVVLTSGYSNVLAENAHRGFDLIQKPYSGRIAVAHSQKSDFRKSFSALTVRSLRLPDRGQHGADGYRAAKGCSPRRESPALPYGWRL